MAGVLDPDVLRLDGDAPLPLDVHGVEVLLAHEPGVDGAGDLEDAVRQRRLAVVDVADDGEVADALDHNGSTGGCGGRHGPSIVPAPPPFPVAWPGSIAASPLRCPRLLGSGRHLLQLSARTGGLPSCRRPLSKHRGSSHVANIKSQIKRNRQNEKRRLRNKSVRAEMRTRSKSAMAAAEDGAEDSAEAAAPGREADRQGGGPGRDPQEHRGQPQVPPGAAGRPPSRRPPPSSGHSPDRLRPSLRAMAGR